MRPPDEELPAIAYLLESMDGEFTELIDHLFIGQEITESSGFFLLSATMQEIVAELVIYRLKMIAWGLAMGLTGINTVDILDDLRRYKNKLPSVYHDRITEKLNHVEEQLRHKTGEVL